jgi:DNA-binding transcriptional ArsR family regulator
MTLYEERAHILKLLAHPVRLEILDLLRRDDECVCHLSAALGRPQPYVSQQLALLRTAGLIVDRKDGNYVLYGLADARVADQVAVALDATASAGHRRVANCPCPKCGMV